MQDVHPLQKLLQCATIEIGGLANDQWKKSGVEAVDLYVAYRSQSTRVHGFNDVFKWAVDASDMPSRQCWPSVQEEKIKGSISNVEATKTVKQQLNEKRIKSI
ncbi:hypothetical protein Pst134EA_027915 [Puccinia striiformis f. sp. tritici]|uniref:hypothetical protein n=1 Tax=Puccinia striiformis f. sp. tritici TaxID=168172 RepID=UPI00200833A4|nr:hypothetical protein Pst134EA_027915 [Puccinia striiformis f. sp. tritici]KAH9448614.1 hypothetical protein Pst134EA_027915 [Puccinia striiformis f. sp. tritici]KAI9607968.1 hypothetical protein H4Q26_005419 [Puccinia striiformis f. sp. tritici PST-130]